MINHYIKLNLRNIHTLIVQIHIGKVHAQKFIISLGTRYGGNVGAFLLRCKYYNLKKIQNGKLPITAQWATIQKKCN